MGGTIPGNLAVAVNDALEYAVAETPDGKYLVVAKDLVEKLSTTLETDLTVKTTLLGKALENTEFILILYSIARVKLSSVATISLPNLVRD